MLDSLNSFFEAVIVGDQQAIIILASVYFAAAGLISMVFCLRIRSWSRTEGILLQSGQEKWGGSMRTDEQQYEAGVRYAYSVAGVDYEGTRLSPTVILVSANLRFMLNWQMRGMERFGVERVTVFYNPSKPRKSYLIRPGAATLLLPMLCILASFFLAFH